MTITAIEFKTAHEAIQHANAALCGEAILLDGKNLVALPSNFVVIATRSGSTAKCTNARRPNVVFRGSRSLRYCSIACSTVCPVNWFFNSAVATGRPFTIKHRSRVLFDAGSNANCRVTVNRFAS